MTESKVRIKKRFFSYWCLAMQKEVGIAAAIFGVLFLCNRLLGGGVSSDGKLVGGTSLFPVLFACVMLQLTTGRTNITTAIAFGSTRKEAVCSYQISRLLAIAEMTALYGIFCAVWHYSTGMVFYAAEITQAVMWLFFAVGISQIGVAVLYKFKDSGQLVLVLTMAMAIVVGAVLQAVDVGNAAQGYGYTPFGFAGFVITAAVYVSGCVVQQKSIKNLQV